MKKTVSFIKNHQAAIVPKYNYPDDACADVFALEDTKLPPLVPVAVRTGIQACLPKGFELQVRPRSGLSLKGVTVFNSPGTIDPAYTGEIKVILVSLDEYMVKKHDKIAQLALSPVTKIKFVEVEEKQWLNITAEKKRKDKGFGSSGC